jgi:hypothetical protein
MKIVIPGGTGDVGGFLAPGLAALGHEVVVLSRSARPPLDGVRTVRWDGLTVGPWGAEVDGSDAVINLAGRSVSCRYTQANLHQMMASRIGSTHAVGEAIAAAARPPRVWLQMSTSTIYAHRFDAGNDERTGVIGGAEPGVPGYWAYSVRIATEWEATQQLAATPATRKLALRSSMVLSPAAGSVFDVLARMVRLGLGGPVAGGAQYFSWIHERDFLRAVVFLMEHDELSGPVNLTAPGPLPQRDAMRLLRRELRVPVGLPATRWMAEIGALVIRSDTELLLKSRRVLPGRLLAAGFTFELPDFADAARDLVRLRRAARHPGRRQAVPA